MEESSHHQRLVAALKKHWAEAGGPVSLTGFLKECRPTIAPLLAKNISWGWIGARVKAVFANPSGEVSDELAPLHRGKKSLIELYSRTTRSLEVEVEITGAAADCRESKANKDDAEAHAFHEKKNASDAVGSAPSAAGPDPPAGRRARIRRSGEIRQNLEPS